MIYAVGALSVFCLALATLNFRTDRLARRLGEAAARAINNKESSS